MIRIPAAVMTAMRSQAEAAYPLECCGLLVGRDEAGAIAVSAGRASPNVTEGDPKKSFLVAPQVHFDLIRELGDGPERIVGHYHSHPDGPARPSAHDRESAFYPDHVWVIIAVPEGRAGEATAHVFDETRDTFEPVAIETEND